MTMQASKPAAVPAVVSTPVFAAMPRASRIRPVLAQVLPPLLVLLALLALWQFAARGPDATLPPPTKVWADARDLSELAKYPGQLGHAPGGADRQSLRLQPA